MIKKAFWNHEQHRVRALWRLIGQILLILIIATPLQMVLGFVGFRMLMVREGISLDQLSDPEAMQQLDPQTVQQFFGQTPILLIFSTVGMLIAFVVSIWLAGRFLDKRPFVDFGFHLNKDWWLDLGFGLGLGALLMLVIFLIELAAGWVTVQGTFITRDPEARFLPAMVPPLITFLAVGFYEELLSRGYHLQNIAEGLNMERIGPRGAIALATLLSSAVFGALHAGNPNASVVSTVNLAIAGVFLALGYLLTGELAIPIGLHITWNFFQGNVFGFPVSGTDFSSATFIAIEQGGPDVLTGGAFGPEAGLIGLGAMAIGIALTCLWARWRYGEARLEISLAEPPNHFANIRSEGKESL
jgi:hypothetical protein